MTDPRPEPPTTADERTMLTAWLDWHRATLELKCAGLDAAQLRERAVPPSTLSLLGLVRHMADVERGWFRRGVAGEDVPPRYYSDGDPDGDFENVSGACVDEAFGTWRDEVERARRIVAEHRLEDTFTRRDEVISLRWVLVHMIEEYARHNGHADLLRERIDGVTGE